MQNIPAEVEMEDKIDVRNEYLMSHSDFKCIMSGKRWGDTSLGDTVSSILWTWCAMYYEYILCIQIVCKSEEIATNKF